MRANEMKRLLLVSTILSLFTVFLASGGRGASSASFFLVDEINSAGGLDSSASYVLCSSAGASTPYGQSSSASYVVWSGIKRLRLRLMSDVETQPSAIALPSEFQLRQNHPNPFNPETRIELDLPVPSRVALRVFDVRGRLIRTLANGNYAAGRHSIPWDGKNDAGDLVSSGVYFYQLEAGGFLATRRMLLVN